MKAKIINTYNIATSKELFGIAFQVKKGKQYCKYPVGMQSYPSKREAKSALIQVEKKLSSLTQDQKDFLNKYPPNKHQYVRL